jgi:predicted dehydrogenase
MGKNGKFRVLIVGSGQIGTRHLQAVASLPQLSEVEIVDPHPAAVRLGKERLSEISDCQTSTTFRWLSSLEKATVGGDLCIVATQADVRCQVVCRVAETLGYSNFLLEKVVSQSVHEYESLIEFTHVKGLSVWVNCKSRAYPFHQRAQGYLNPSEPVQFSVLGSNHGLATNGVHAADLFLAYDGANQIHSSGSIIDPILHPSKRGEGIFDLSGTLHGYTEKGSHFMVSYSSDNHSQEHTTIMTPRYRCIVDQMRHWAYESDADNGWAWRPAIFDDNLLISQMTKAFATDILTMGRCELPTLEECFPAHKFILSELLPHFNKLLDVKGDRCPVT